LFPPDAIRTLSRLTGGVPRLLNVICDRALLGTYIQGKERIDKKTLLSAAREVSGKKPNQNRRTRQIYLWIVTLVIFLLNVLIAAGIVFHVKRTQAQPGSTQVKAAQAGQAASGPDLAARIDDRSALPRNEAAGTDERRIYDENW